MGSFFYVFGNKFSNCGMYYSIDLFLVISAIDPVLIVFSCSFAACAGISSIVVWEPSVKVLECW